MDFKNLVKTHQNTIVLSVGYVLVAILAFGIGRISALELTAPDVRVEEVFQAPLNNTAISESVQSAQIINPAAESAQNCAGKIKGSASQIYHVPSGAFYERTTKPVACFDTEAEAQAAGFRKSSR